MTSHWKFKRLYKYPEPPPSHQEAARIAAEADPAIVAARALFARKTYRMAPNTKTYQQEWRAALPEWRKDELRAYQRAYDAKRRRAKELREAQYLRSVNSPHKTMREHYAAKKAEGKALAESRPKVVMPGYD